MQRIVVTLAWLLVASGCSAPQDPLPEQRGRLLPQFIGLRTHKGMAAFEDGELIAEYIDQLEQKSPTFRDMLDTLSSVQGLKVLLSPATGPDGTAGVMGWTVLRPSPASFAAWTDIVVDHTNPSRSVGAVAHEFGHIAEAACVGRYRSVKELQSALRQRGSEPTGPLPGMQGTPFVNAVGRAVIDEWEEDRPSERDRKSVV